jgi:malate/lactate dehydrogenase
VSDHESGTARLAKALASHVDFNPQSRRQQIIDEHGTAVVAAFCKRRLYNAFPVLREN